MVLGVVFLRGANNAPHTLKNLIMIDVGIMTHLCSGAIVVIHLTVYEVVPSLLDLYVSRYVVVQDTAFSVPQVPARYAEGIWQRKHDLLVSKSYAPLLGG